MKIMITPLLFFGFGKHGKNISSEKYKVIDLQKFKLYELIQQVDETYNKILQNIKENKKTLIIGKYNSRIITLIYFIMKTHEWNFEDSMDFVNEMMSEKFKNINVNEKLLEMFKIIQKHEDYIEGEKVKKFDELLIDVNVDKTPDTLIEYHFSRVFG